MREHQCNICLCVFEDEACFALCPNCKSLGTTHNWEKKDASAVCVELR